MKKIYLESVSVSELIETIRNLIKENIPAPIPNFPKRYISRTQAAEILGVSLPTLDKHSRSGLLKSYRIGRRKMFRLDQVESCLEEVASLRSGRRDYV
ncbi:helix-turn-helix domain-containing protein [Ancylomarina sp. 16SWW S1-10-2]|uniref:helix-turn-helix domain-containing protein n=1 Tax=Ancylomarina sp. 16SWW S1-10-2 TaxID=2499681 RepID=UPI0012AD69C5|nr:DNA-binding protein [Ancylomarina sp. 16SWW S1-10-2]